MPATAAGIYTPPTGNPLIDGELWGYKWASPNLTYAFPTTVAAYDYALQGFAPFTAAAQAAHLSVFNDFAKVSGLTFTQAADPATANIRAALATGIDYARSGTFNTPGEGANTGEGNPPDPAFALKQIGDTWYNTTQFNDPKVGDYAYFTILHELGHALGLKHGHSTQGVTNQTVVMPALPADRDSYEFSVMTYRAFIGGPTAGNNAPETFGYSQSLMMADIAALQHMYGANFGATANNTNTVYAFDAATGAMSINGVAQVVGDGTAGSNRVFRTVWDGGGVDTYDFSNFAQNQQVDLRPGQWSKFSDAQLANLGTANGGPAMARANLFNALQHQGDARSLIENVITGSGADTIVGNDANNQVIGGAGADIIDGGAGFDTVSFAGSNAAVQVFLSAGLGAGQGGDAQGDLYTSVEGVIGSAAGDVLTGAAGVANTISAGGGNDTVYGEGADTLNGGEGVDVLFGGQGGALSLDVAASGFEIIWTSFASDSLNGSTATADLQLIGQGPTADTLIGGAGNDFIYGRAGDSVMGGAGNDWAWMSLSGGGVTLDMAPAGFENAWGSALNDTISAAGSAAAVVIVGDAGADQITGGGAGDFLYGFAGNDILTGGGGADVLVGGANADTFRFNAPGFGTDLIFDFATAEGDKINLAGSGVAAFGDLTLANVGGSTMISAAQFGAGQIWVVGVAALAQSDFLFA